MKAKWSPNHYKQERNRDKWLIGVVILILVGTAFLVTLAVIMIRNASDNEKELYKQGYHDAKLIYECDHDRTECEILKDTL